eukprot:3410197-Pyramimonas_sp.AAC.1
MHRRRNGGEASRGTGLQEARDDEHITKGVRTEGGREKRRGRGHGEGTLPSDVPNTSEAFVKTNGHIPNG